MLNLVWPLALVLIVLPVVLYLIPTKSKSNILYYPRAKVLKDMAVNQVLPAFRVRWNWLCWFLVWALLCLALARPIWIGELVSLPREGRNIMLAVDISGSMRKQDMIVNSRRADRLTMVKIVVDEFIKQRQGDKVGLILFGTQAFLQSPLSYDLKTVQRLLNESVIGLAGENTAIGDAIGLTIKHTENVLGDRILILLTDGQNTAGSTDPLVATKYAKEANLKIYTIGIGRRSLFNQGVDINLINTIAKESGGRSYLVSNLDELKRIYQHVSKLEPTQDKDNSFRLTRQLYFIPLGAALCLSLLILCINWLWRKYRYTQ